MIYSNMLTHLITSVSVQITHLNVKRDLLSQISNY